jgi:hypothetical protein
VSQHLAPYHKRHAIIATAETNPAIHQIIRPSTACLIYAAPDYTETFLSFQDKCLLKGARCWVPFAKKTIAHIQSRLHAARIPRATGSGTGDCLSAAVASFSAQQEQKAVSERLARQSLLAKLTNCA